MKQQSHCRWGILSAAGIAQKNWRSIAVSGNSTLLAVAARRRESAQNFIDACQSHTPFVRCPEAIEGYAALLERPDIDAVYIPLPTAIRAEWIRRALEAGKHVLAEKPAGIDADEVQALIELAASKKKQFMDGVMFMHSPRLAKMRTVLDDGTTVGQLKRIATHFSFRGDDAFQRTNIRSMSQYEPHGCLGDLGWYCIRLILWAKKYQMPSAVRGRVLHELQGEGSPDKVPGEFSGELFYEDGFSANFYCSFLTENQQWAHMSGSHGSLMLRDFVLPFYGGETYFETSQPTFDIDRCDFHMRDQRVTHSTREYSEGHPSAQEVELFRTFSDLVLRQTLAPQWGEITLKTQRVLDAAFCSGKHDSSLIQL